MTTPNVHVTFRELEDRLQDFRMREVPAHLIHRLAVMVGGEVIEYVDSNLYDFDKDGAIQVSGRIVVFTAERVILADASGSQRDPDDGSGSSVAVETWPRAALISLALVRPSSPEVGSFVNSDLAWAEVGFVPKDLRIHLRYPDRRDLELPVRRSSPKASSKILFEFMPALLSDIGRSTH